MSRSVKFFLMAATAGFLSVTLPASADRPNNEKVNENDPVVKCQRSCQGEKNNEAYEACMLKCKENYKKEKPIVPNMKK